MDFVLLRQAGTFTAITLGLAASCLAEENVSAGSSPGTGRSISASGQFLVYGKRGEDRGIFCSFSEKLRENLGKVLKIGGEWKYPVVIQLHTQRPALTPDRFVRGSVRPTDEGFRFQVDVLLMEGFGPDELSEEILRMLLLERMLGADPSLRSPEREERLLPHWLHFGIVELVRYRRVGVPNQLYESIMASNRILPIAEVMEGNPTKMNSVSRAVFGASAAALVKALLGLDSGSQRLVAFMEGLPRHKGDQLDLLRRVYPDLVKSKASLEKWWALEVVSMGQPGAMDFLDQETTQERLQEALVVRFQAPAGGKKGRKEDAPGSAEETVCHLSEYQKILKLDKEQRGEVLARNEGLLLRLSLEAFPAYRGLITEYRRLLWLVAAGKTKGLEGAFKVLEESAFILGQRLRGLEDHMNWYEATQLDQKSGAFKDYKRAIREMRRQAPPRDDRVSKYLDSVEERLPE